MNILIISPSFPFPPDDGVKIRLFNLIKRISQKHSVALLSFVGSVDEMHYVSVLSQYCSAVETVVLQRRSRWAKIFELIYALFSGVPLESRLAFDQEMADKTRALLAARHFDIVQIEHTFMAPYNEMIPSSSDTKRVISIIDIGFIQFRRMFKVEKRLLSRIRWFANWLIMRTWEIRVLGAFDKCIAVSSLDKQLLKRINPKLDISVIENGVDIDRFEPLPENEDKKTILFIGVLDYEANVDAALYFYSEILPLIKKHFQQIKWFIVGKRPLQSIRNLAKDRNVTVTGYVNDILSIYRSCDISVVPLRAGGGSRLKILEAMALGRAVVSTTLGKEGLDVIDGRQLFIADTPEEFAQKTIRLLTDKNLYTNLVREGRKYVEAKHGWDAIADHLLKVYEDLTSETDVRRLAN